tara:strand:+ start:1057 stop:1290 length:234 start_codon:yes stop_codon:yes gene_type:complete
MKLTVIVRKGEEQYVALCPELDVVSQGYEIKEALANLKEAIELYLEVEGLPEGIGEEDLIITSIEVGNNGKAPAVVR